MPISSGLGAQLGVAIESTYGTFVPPTSFFPTFQTEGLELQPDYVETEGLRSDVIVQQDGLHSVTTRHGEGDVALTPVTAGLGKWLNLLHGDTVTPTGAGTAKTQLHKVGLTVPDGKSISVQTGIPGTDGVRRAKNAVGTTAGQAAFNLERGGVLESTWSLHSRDVETSDTVATATYPASFETFVFLGSKLQLDDADVGSCVSSAQIQVQIPKKTDRYCLNGSGLTLTPLTNGLVVITGNIGLEFSGGWSHFSAFKNATRRKLTLECVGSRVQLAAGPPAVYGSLKFTLDKVVVTGGGTPVVSGPDVVSTTVAFKALGTTSATAPLAIEYVSADAAL